MAVRARPALLLTAAVLACAAFAHAVPAWAHDGQDMRPGAAQVDLEVLLTPALNGETSPGGQQPSVTVDRFGNVVGAALKEQAQRLVSADGRATTKTRLASWRWSSGDEGESFQNVGRSPAEFDTLLPGGLSTVATSDDAGHSFVVEAYGALALVTQVTATGRDALTTDATIPIPVGAGAQQRVLADATGSATTTGRLYLLATGTTTGTGSTTVWSGPVASTGGSETALPGSSGCTLAADHRTGSRLVYAACVSSSGAVLWTSKDAGRTFSSSALPGPAPLDPPSVAVGPDGSPWVLVTTGTRLLAHHVPVKGRVTTQDLTTEKGQWRGGVLDVSRKGRLGVAAYHLAPQASGWHVRLAITSPAVAPLWVDFASHDPVSDRAAGPPDTAPAVAFGPDARLHLVWTSTKIVVPNTSSPLLRNIWSVRTLST